MRERIAIATVVCALTGCAIMNPYRTMPVKTHVATFEEAQAEAGAQMDQYKRALGESGKFRRAIGIGVVPVSAAALGLGMRGDHAKLVTGLGLTAASAIGLGQWLDSSASERAWIAGYKATNCAIAVSKPFGDQPAELDAPLGTLNQTLVGLEEAIAGVRLAKVGSTEGLDALVDSEIGGAESVLASGAKAHAAGVALRQQRRNAPDALLSAINRIAASVAEFVERSELDLSTLNKIISGIATSYTSVTTVPESLRPKDAASGAGSRDKVDPPSALESAVESDLRAALALLSSARAAAGAATRPVADLVSAISPDTFDKKLEECGVDPAALERPLAVTPAGDISFDEGSADSQAIVAKGGKPPYAFKLVGAPDGVTLDADSFAVQAVVRATDTAAAGVATLVITDYAHGTVAVKVVVKPKPVDSGGEQKRAVAAVAPDAKFAALSDLERRQLQKALCVKPDGVWGLDTLNALHKHQRLKTRTEGALTDADVTELNALDPAEECS
jgi:hypothetical protein